jgi:ribosomal protein L29
MSFDALKGKPEKELTARLNELMEEGFKARFTTESAASVGVNRMSARGAEMLKRRREIARIKTVLQGRKTLEAAKKEQAKLEAAIKGIGAPHEGTIAQKNARRKLATKLEHVNRTVQELSALKS